MARSVLCSWLRSSVSLILLQFGECVAVVGNRESGAVFVGYVGVWNGAAEAGWPGCQSSVEHRSTPNRQCCSGEQKASGVALS